MCRVTSGLNTLKIESNLLNGTNTFLITDYLFYAEQQAMGADNHLTPLTTDRPFMRGDMLNLPRAIVNPQVKTDVNSS